MFKGDGAPNGPRLYGHLLSRLYGHLLSRLYGHLLSRLYCFVPLRCKLIFLFHPTVFHLLYLVLQQADGRRLTLPLGFKIPAKIPVN